MVEEVSRKSVAIGTPCRTSPPAPVSRIVV